MFQKESYLECYKKFVSTSKSKKAPAVVLQDKQAKLDQFRNRIRRNKNDQFVKQLRFTLPKKEENLQTILEKSPPKVLTEFKKSTKEISISEMYNTESVRAEPKIIQQ